MTEKRYNSFSEHLKRKFGGRVHKISVDAGFSCPNRDGTRDRPGCIFCDSSGSGAVGIDRRLGIGKQIELAKEVMTRKYKARRFLAYFQPFSNTWGDPATLRELYDQALAVPEVVGLAVGTRPDCLPQPVLDLLAEYHRRTYFWLELGLQSIHDKTLARLNRGHDFATFLKSFQKAKSRGLRICVHVILGLPGESKADMMATADALAGLGIEGIKIHLLHILEGTPLARIFREEPFPVLTQEEYVELTVDILRRLPAATLIHRLTGDGPRDRLIAPLWSLNKWEVLNAIDAKLEVLSAHQGDLCQRPIY